MKFDPRHWFTSPAGKGITADNDDPHSNRSMMTVRTVLSIHSIRREAGIFRAANAQGIGA